MTTAKRSTRLQRSSKNKMFAPFDTHRAYKVCVELLNQLNSNKIRLTNTAKTKSSRDGHGIMLGALVAARSPSPDSGAEGPDTPDDAQEAVILVTNSGIRYRLEGDLSSYGFTYVEPVVSACKIDGALNKNDAKIHELTRQIQETDDAEIRSCLSKERSALCDESLKNVFALYNFACADKKNALPERNLHKKPSSHRNRRLLRTKTPQLRLLTQSDATFNVRSFLFKRGRQFKKRSGF